MKTFIDSSSALTPLGVPPGKQVHRIAEGLYAGRLVIVYQADPSTIVMVYADSPYTEFSAPLTIVTNAADSPFSTFMNGSGDLYLAYVVNSANDLAFVKIPFTDGVWSPLSPVTVYTSDDTAYPSLARLSNDYVWISYSRISGGLAYVSAKVSTDDGQSFGTVTEPGDTLTGGAIEAYSQICEAHGRVYIFYSEGGTKCAYRDKALSAGLWDTETVVAATTGLDDRFQVAVSPDGRIGIAFADSAGLKYLEYSGSRWSGEFVVQSGATNNPVCAFRSGRAYVLFGTSAGSDMNLVQYAYRDGDAFTTPTPLDVRNSLLQRVILFDDSAGTYADRSSEAASETPGDVSHGTSGALLEAIGDRLYCGADAPFHYLRIILSTPGTAGTVTWKYWNGQVWEAFTPHSGDWHFTSASRDHLLWPDFDTIPSDWQRRDVAGDNLFWIMAVVSGAFSTAPVGTQLTAVSQLTSIKVQE
jgi:hypothetical protein